jgi:hypothetical protein
VEPADSAAPAVEDAGPAAGAELPVTASAALDAAPQARPRAAEDRRARMQRSMRAMAIVGRAFQADSDATTLSFAELERSFDAYDADGDQAITAAEFAARAPDLRGGDGERGAEDTDPWAALLEGLDGDADGALDFDELEAFFVRRDDGDGVWRLEGRRSR